VWTLAFRFVFCKLKILNSCFDGMMHSHEVVYMSFIFLSNTTVYQLTHISLCIIEFIGRIIPLHVSAYGAIFR
jgi:hypothetical protein